MCWIGEKNDWSVAVKDMKVFKAMYIKTDEEIPRYYAPMTGFEYTLGKLYETEPLETKVDRFGHHIIEKGLHSFSLNCATSIRKKESTFDTYEVYAISGYTFFDVFEDIYPVTKIPGVSDVIRGRFVLIFLECIIPEGTKYYENEKGEIVSEKLIVTNKKAKVNVLDRVSNR